MAGTLLVATHRPGPMTSLVLAEIIPVYRNDQENVRQHGLAIVGHVQNIEQSLGRDANLELGQSRI